MTSTDAAKTFALDRASVRTTDGDGHLHVARTPISKANVCPYYGREIPDWQTLGLDGEKIYQLYRAPDELEKAASTFNGKPLLFGHKPTTAVDHDHSKTVGSVTGVEWDAPYLYARLDIWPSEAKTAIESGEHEQLSSAYRYRADMTPGSANGVRFDGVMRDISGNHVALVPEGRAGPDVVVADSAMPKLEEIFMAGKTKASLAAATAQGALMIYLRPKLAQDAKIDLSAALKGITGKTFKAKVKDVVAGVKTAVKGKLAQDADIEDVAEVLEAIAPMLKDDDPADEADVTIDDEDAALKAALKAKGYTDEEIERICAKSMAAADETEEEKKKREEAEKKVAAMDAQMKTMVTKADMDTAIKSATKMATDAEIKRQSDIYEARAFVRPWVGEITVACDSAEAINRAALEVLGVEVKGIPAEALKFIVEAQPKPGALRNLNSSPAMDEAAVAGFAKRVPEATRIRIL